MTKSDPNTIYAGTDNGRLWKTTTLGSSWQEFPNPFAPAPARWVTSVIADPVDPSHAYVSYGGFREGYRSANVYETTIAGHALKLKNISGNLPNAPVNFLAYDRPNDTVYAATDLGVFFMQHDNKVWTKLGDNLPNTATEDLKIQASSGQALRRHLRPRHLADPARRGRAALQPAGGHRPGRALEPGHRHGPCGGRDDAAEQLDHRSCRRRHARARARAPASTP